MANLNVKVIDAKDGKVTKVEHGGVSYELVDRKAEKGDLLRIVSGYSFVTRDGFYEVERIDGAGDPQIIDDDGDDYGTDGDEFEVFAQVKPAATALKVGDLAKVVKKSRSMAGFSVGDRVRITDDKNSGVHDLCIHRADGSGLGFCNYEHLTPIEEKRLKVGDLAKMTEDSMFRKGDIVKLIHDDGSSSPKFKRLSDGEEWYEGLRCLELYTPAPGDKLTIDGVEYTLESRKAKIGERVLVVGNASSHRNNIGDIVEITKVDDDGSVANTGYSDWMWHDKGEYLVFAAQKRFSVGDLAKVVSAPGKLEIGDIVKITPDESTYHDFRVARLSDGTTEAFDASELEPYKPQAGDELTVAGVKYRLEARKAGKGERVIATTGGEPYFKAGNIGEVRYTADRSVYAKISDYIDGTWYVKHDDYLVLAPVSAPKVFKKGDEVRYFNDIRGYIGRTVERVDEREGKVWFTNGNWMPVDRVELVPSAPKFKEGEKVRVVGSDHRPRHYHRVGSVGVVRQVDEISSDYAVVVDGVEQWVSEDDLAPVPSQRAIMKGDKVRIVSKSHRPRHWHEIGEVGEVVESYGSGKYGVLINDCYQTVNEKDLALVNTGVSAPVFAAPHIRTFTLDDLAGRTLTIRRGEDDGVATYVARDTNSGELFVLDAKSLKGAI